jgi:LPXTG-motif cell wall-anchored protein
MPVVRKSSVRAALAVVPMALAVVLGTAGLAHATEEDRRATIHDGNVDAGQKGACATAGLDGQPLQPSDFDFSDGEPDVDQYLTINSVADGIIVTGIVVKGGPAYNVYVPDEGLEATPPWTDLRSPLNDGGNIPTISHWFACGVPNGKTPSSEAPTKSKPEQPSKSSESTPPKTSSSTPTESTPGTSGESSSAPSTTSTVGGSVTTTTTPGVVAVENASDSDDLAYTGVGSSWLLWAGGLLVLAGAAVLALLRIRRNA